MLRDIPEEVLKTVANNPDYLNHYSVLLNMFHDYMKKNSMMVLGAYSFSRM
jgi:hypothetical protein